MKKILYLASVLVIAIMVGCQKENDVPNVQDVSNMVFSASIEGNPDSRTGVEYDEVNNVNKVVWLENDRLSIFAGNGRNSKFILSEGENTGSGNFVSDNYSGNTESNNSSVASLSANVAYYPYKEDLQVTQSENSYIISTIFPAVQTFSKSGSIGNGALPMVAVTSSIYDNVLSFKNVGGIFRIPLTGTATITKIKFTAQGKKLAGDCIITAQNASPYINVNTQNGVSTITLNCGENGVELNSTTPTNFVVAMLPVEIDANGLEITIYDENGKYMTYVYDLPVSLGRSTSRTTPTVSYEATNNVGVEEANEQLTGGDTDVAVVIAEDDVNPTLELPANSSENPTNLTFVAITEGQTVQLSAKDDSNGNEAKNVNVSVPESTNGYDFVITLPNSTVTLEANGEKAVYDEVTATTADNTLIISKNVTVNTLKVKKGHVRVFGAVKNISRESANEDGVTYLIKESGATIPSGLEDEKIVVVSAADYGLLQFLKNATTGDSYTLTGNVNISINTELPAGITLDGANYSVSTSVVGTEGVGKGVFVLNEGTVIKNITFISPNTQYDLIVKGASTIENCKFPTATASDFGYGKRAIFTGSESLTGVLSVTNCTFDDQVYAFNFSKPTNEMDIIFTGCTMKGWLSGHGASHKFVNCIFGKSGDYQNYIPYCSASFVGCTFSEGFMISIKHASTLAFDENCKVGSTLLTAPSQLSWDDSGDGQDNGTSETVIIGGNSWVNEGTTEETVAWENGLLVFLKTANNGDSYTLTGNVSIPADTEIPSGVTIDGGEKKYSVSTTVTGTEGIGKGVFVLNEGSTIKNVTFASPLTQYDIIVKGASAIESCNFTTATAESLGKGKRAIFTGSESLTGELSITNCTFDDKVYAFNFSKATNEMDITFTGCTMKGWLSGHGASHKFVNCEFGMSGDYQNYIPYCGASFAGCTFSEGFKISIKHAGTLSFDENCKVGSTLLTAPSQLSWDDSGDGQDNGASETVYIGGNSWVNSGTTEETVAWKNGLLAFLETAKTGDSYTLTGNVSIPANTEVPSGVIINGSENKYSVSTTVTGTEGIGKGVFVLNSDSKIENVTFASPLTQYDIIVKGASAIESCNFTTATAESLGKGKRAIFTGSESLTGALSVTNCTFDDQVYAFNFSNATNEMDITFTGCTMKGWLSGHGASHKFVNCIFGKSGDYQNYIPYCSASFVGCTFSEGFMISIKHASTLAFDENCKVGSTLLTAPSQLSWDDSGDGQDNGTSETVIIGGNSWVNEGTTEGEITWIQNSKD